MFVCGQFVTKVWHPDLSSSGQSNPTWTRLICDGVEIANSLEWADWLENPVQVILCETCGHEGCASSGYVHVSRLDHYVLWSAAQPKSDTEYANCNHEPPQIIRTRGALAIPAQVWNKWATTIRELPHADRLAPANRAAVADAWVLGPGRSTADLLGYLRGRLVGGDTLAKETALSLVERTLILLQTTGEVLFDQPLVNPTEAGAQVEKLYFDGPAELDWPAFAFAGTHRYIVLDHEHMIEI
jgi:hypothetical protein